MKGTADSEEIGPFLREHAPFDQMRPEHMGFLMERLRPIAFAAGDVITDPEAGTAEWFYILKQGRIAVSDEAEAGPSADGARELRPGECFPIGALVANRAVRSIRRAVDDVVCLTIDRTAFDELRAASAAFNDHCTHSLSGLLNEARRQVQAEAARGLSGDSSLDIALADKDLRKPTTATAETPIIDVLKQMSAQKIGSMVITDPAARPIGIFTLKDLLNRVAVKGLPLDGPIGEVMTRDPVSVPRTAFAFEAAMAMADAGIQHVCVVESEKLVGVLSERDLFSLQRVGLVNLTKSIGRAETVQDVARLATDIHALVNQMIAQGIKVGQITQIITLLNDHIVVRVIDLVLAEAGGPPDIPFTWLAFGSEGRREQTLKTDQDNGILFAAPRGMSAGEARAILMPIADKVNTALDICGFPLCTGGIMARNADCCRSLEEWQAQFARWIDQGTPEHLLKAAIFFDFRPIWGPDQPVRDLRAWLLERTASNSRFQKQMAASALQNTPPLGLFRAFRLSGEGDQSGTIDLKFAGVTPFVDAARILALAHNVPATNTAARLQGVQKLGALDENDVNAWGDAYDYIRVLRMRINDEQAAAGAELTNRIAPDTLTELDRRIMKEAFREAKRLQSKIALDYQL